MNIGVVISSGIGNAIMVIPLLKLFKRDLSTHVTLLNASPFLDHDFLKTLNLPIDNLISANNARMIIEVFMHIKKFDCIYLDISSSSYKNIALSLIMAKKVIAMRKNRAYFLPYHHVVPELGMHNILLNLLLIKKDKKNISKPYFPYVQSLNYSTEKNSNQELLGKEYFFVQVSSGNFRTPYKNWPLEYWIAFLHALHERWPKIHIVLVGDNHEITYGKNLEKNLSFKTINLIGKTNLSEAACILKNAVCYIGLDSGWMHLAAAFDIPTFTIFGATSIDFLGYEQFNKNKHRNVYQDIDCWPCHVLVGKNTSRVKNVMDCPDNICLYLSKPEKVFNEFTHFIQSSGILNK